MVKRDSSPRTSVYVAIFRSERGLANHAIRQHVNIVSENQKYNKLVKLLEDIMDGSRILIFMDTKKGCDQITRQLRMDGWPTLSIHGDKSQAERDWVLSEFKDGKSRIMSASEILAGALKDSKRVVLEPKIYNCECTYCLLLGLIVIAYGSM